MATQTNLQRDILVLNMEEQMEEIAGNLNSELGTDDVVVHLTMKLADGQTIVDKDYTE